MATIIFIFFFRPWRPAWAGSNPIAFVVGRWQSGSDLCRRRRKKSSFVLLTEPRRPCFRISALPLLKFQILNFKSPHLAALGVLRVLAVERAPRAPRPSINPDPNTGRVGAAAPPKLPPERAQQGSGVPLNASCSPDPRPQTPDPSPSPKTFFDCQTSPEPVKVSLELGHGCRRGRFKADVKCW